MTLNPTSAQIAEAIVQQRPPLYRNSAINPDACLTDLVRALVEHDDVTPGEGIGAHITKHAMADLALVEPLAGLDGAMFADDIARIVERARTWLQLAPEIERRINEANSEPIAPSKPGNLPAGRVSDVRDILNDAESILHELRRNLDTMWLNVRDLQTDESSAVTIKLIDEHAHAVVEDVHAAEDYLRDVRSWLQSGNGAVS
jgi:hypothetical protein